MKQDLHLVYVLHTRAYRETSMLVEILSQQHGRVAMVAKGVKRGKSKASTILQPFVPLQVSWVGSGDLVTMTQVEETPQMPPLQARRAICGLYVNELMVKLVPKWDVCNELFRYYQTTLQNLAVLEINEQISLRKFEKQLLKSLGYGLQLSCEVENGAQIQADQFYTFDPILGPKLASELQVASIKGSTLLGLEVEEFGADTNWAELRRLMRGVLAHHLGEKQLVSRTLL